MDRSRQEQPDRTAALQQLKKELKSVASIADVTERLLEVTAIVGEALSDLDVQPVVVGGLALAYWSDSDEFITGDIDVVVPRVPELADRLRTLGFEQRGREWFLPGYEVVFEAPDEVLEPGDESEWAELASGRRVRILALEDMLLWRLREWVNWHHASGFHQAAHLLVSDQVDTERLERRAREEGLALARPNCADSPPRSRRAAPSRSGRSGNLEESSSDGAMVRRTMSRRDLSYSAWRERRGRQSPRLADLDAGLPPFRRLRLRGANEARFLRSIGTPEDLIGPVGSDDALSRQRRELIAFARRLRSSR